MGNHDKALLDETSIDVFNADARAALYLDPFGGLERDVGFLASLPEIVYKGDFTLVHGSPRQPIWEYILDRGVAQTILATLTTPYCLVGHTHVPVTHGVSKSESAGFVEPADYLRPRSLQVDDREERLILNPGSVGQPRDNNANAAYALLDTQTLTWEYCRLSTTSSRLEDRMRLAGLPARLVNRLAYGW